MRLFYIRHAPTSVSFTGEIVKDYDRYGVVSFDREKWLKEVGSYISNDFVLLSSPLQRAVETAKILFPEKECKVMDSLREFDCSKLGDKKFWEISEEEFNSLVGLTKRVITDKIVEFLCDCSSYGLDAQIVAVGHGFYGRCLYDYYSKGETCTPFEILNSKNFRFNNLDMMEIERCKVQNVFRFLR